MAGINLGDLLLDSGTRHSDQLALVTPTAYLTYGELLRQALQLAAFLTEAGLRPGDRVVICLPKCVELSTAIFGTLLAGGCYVPLDYTTPAPRAQLIVADVEPKAVICTHRMARRLFEGLAGTSTRDLGHTSDRQIFVHILATSTSRPELWASTTPWIGAMNSAPLSTPVSVDPAAIAYILYTSGSTGRPKGVIHTHKSAMAFVSWAANHLDLGLSDVLSQHASPSFDLTVFDFFCSALVAAPLVSVPEWMFGRVARTCRFIVENGITVWYSVPSALLRQGEVESLRELSRSSLRRVIFAGEVIPKGALRDFAENLPPRCVVSNWYGPTETNVCTFHDITRADLKSDGPVPIGLPCPYADVRLDPEADAETGKSGEGELLVASATNMEGYWKLDDITTRAFTKGPEGRIYYRTGDSVTYSDGRFLFLGRKDRLLKVRGYRIQPEEVEQVLQQREDVIEAVVVAAREDGLDRLVAVVAMTSPEDEILADLERYCAEMLPPYMVPSRIVRVAALPRGSRGKVDLDAVSRLCISPD